MTSAVPRAVPIKETSIDVHCAVVLCYLSKKVSWLFSIKYGLTKSLPTEYDGQIHPLNDMKEVIGIMRLQRRAAVPSIAPK